MVPPNLKVMSGIKKKKKSINLPAVRGVKLINLTLWPLQGASVSRVTRTLTYAIARCHRRHADRLREPDSRFDHSVVSTNRPRGGENPLTTGVKQAVPYRTGREARYLSVSLI